MALTVFHFENSEFIIDSGIDTDQASVRIDGTLVSEAPAIDGTSVHEIQHPVLGHLSINLATQNDYVTCQVYRHGELVVDTQLTLLPAPHPESPYHYATPPKSSFSWLSLGLIGLKLLKTVQVVKVALLAASVAVYSVMFTVEFALALIAVLVFHEYGHLRAMKKFGLPTKGMYLIPFVGGLAVGDAPRTRWQDVYISLMGPVYGLAMTVMFYLVYLITGSHFAGLVTSVSALVNLFNLIPVHPLDGGRVVKAMVFSRRNRFALLSFLILAAACFAAAWQLGLYFLVFFIVIGVVDILSSWRTPLANDLAPLSRYGIVFCAVWYLSVAAAFIGMILLLAHDRLPGAEIALKVLES